MVFFSSDPMNFFDRLYFSVFDYYKQKRLRLANRISVFYVSLVQAVLLLYAGIFLAEFFKNMNVVTISAKKAWTLYGIAVVFFYFKNWMQYSGKRRLVKGAKYKTSKSLEYNFYIFWMIPLLLVGVAVVLIRLLN